MTGFQARAARTDPLHALQAQQANRDRVFENSGRYARYECTVMSNGVGTFLQPIAIIFDATFTELPAITTSHYVDGTQLSMLAVPRVSSGVFKWVQDSHNFYVGAWVYTIVDGVAPMGDYFVQHHFTFAGISMKTIPAYLLDK